jgi:ABC-type bacteriocin/lantibiotic exporter with double-glycine peptidase domain
MSIEVPHYTQAKINTCALACLRMVLAAYGMLVEEGELEAQAAVEVKGTPTDELVRLARQYGLVADVQDTTVEGLWGILAEGKPPIAYLARAVFDLRPSRRERHPIRDAIIHNVIPTQVGARFVTLHDPRQPRVTRKTIRLFRRAYEGLGGRCVVCAEPAEA